MAIVMIGNPNVGKSMVLNRITGSNFIVSNYAGTSLEISKAEISLPGTKKTIIDTPGIYSIYSSGPEQIAIKELLEREEPELIFNVVDANNLERNLILTYELKELKIPVIILVNQIDRARKNGLQINKERMEQIIGAPVVFFSALTGEGLMEVFDLLGKDSKALNWPSKVQVDSLNDCFKGCSFNCANCALATENCLHEDDFRRAEMARYTAQLVVQKQSIVSRYWLDKIEALLDRPYLGTFLLLMLVYLAFLALLEFIKLSEGPLAMVLSPISNGLEKLLIDLLPAGTWSTVISKAVPEGLIIPFTIIMPAMLIVGFFMSLLEDSGILPRYSVALERTARLFGVSGQAVIPLSLGFGCRTPAVLASRLMPNASERFIVIALLSIVIPCAATLGVMSAVISAFNASLAILIISMVVTLVVLGFVLSRFSVREEVFIFELPPLRIPEYGNVLKKVKMRFAGFFTEVLPLLLVMNIIIRALMEVGFFEMFNSMESITRALFGIPADAFVAVLVTIFQRYLAPLVLLNIDLTPREATIAISMISLSLPCLPVMVMTIREIGLKGLSQILIMGISTSITIGIILNLVIPG